MSRAISRAAAALDAQPPVADCKGYGTLAKEMRPDEPIRPREYEEVISTSKLAAALGDGGSSGYNSTDCVTQVVPTPCRKDVDSDRSCWNSHQPLEGASKVSTTLVVKIRMSRGLDAKYAEKLEEYYSEPDYLQKVKCYGNMVPHHTWAFRQPHVSNWRAHPRKFATKLHAVSRSVAQSKQKALICVSRAGGLDVLVELLRRQLQATEREGPCPSIAVLTRVAGRAKGVVYDLSVPGKTLQSEPGAKAVSERFNCPERNAHGEDIGVIVWDTAQESEGINFVGVDHVDFVDVPESWAQWKQLVDRAVPSKDHNGLPENESCARVRIWTSERRSGEMSADGELLEQLKSQGATSSLCVSKQEAICARSIVQVLCTTMSTIGDELNAGWTGKVDKIDEVGDALIYFEALEACRWVAKSNLHNLKVVPQVKQSGIDASADSALVEDGEFFQYDHEGDTEPSSEED